MEAFWGIICSLTFRFAWSPELEQVNREVMNDRISALVDLRPRTRRALQSPSQMLALEPQSYCLFRDR